MGRANPAVAPMISGKYSVPLAERSLAPFGNSSADVASAIQAKSSNGSGSAYGISAGRPMRARLPAGSPPLSTQYPNNINANNHARPGDGTSYTLLRQLAESCDIIGCISLIREAQLRTLDTKFLSSHDDHSTEPEDLKALLKNATDFWLMPDRMNRWDFQQWAGAVKEDLEYCGRTSIYPHKTNKGKLTGVGVHSFRVLDVATIAPRFSDIFTVPEPPEIAYQQIINGTPLEDFTADELLNYELYPRAYRSTGKAPMEFIAGAIITRIRRSAKNLARYTDGVVPELFIVCDEGTSVTTDKMFDAVSELNERLAGDDRERMRLIPLPAGSRAQEINQITWSREEDEWLARLVCAAFGVNPMWFVTMMNRATSETQESAAFDSGIGPLKDTISGIVTRLERFRTGRNDIEHVYTTDETDIPLERAQVLQIYDSMGWASKETLANVIGLPTWEAMKAFPPGPVMGAAQVGYTGGGMPRPEPAVVAELVAGAAPVAAKTEPAPTSQASETTFNELTLGLERLKEIGDNELINATREAIATKLGIKAPSPITVPSVAEETVQVEAQVAQVKAGDVTPEKPTLSKAARSELATWRKIAGKSMAKALAFECHAVPAAVAEPLRKALGLLTEPAAIDALFKATAASEDQHRRAGEKGFAESERKIAHAAEAWLLNEVIPKVLLEGAA